MTKVPEKCSRCGAPIDWEEGASIVKCNFCGYKNNLKNDFLNFKVNKKIKDKINKIYLPAKKILKNRLFRISLVIIFISTPIIIYKNNHINPGLILLCEEKSRDEKTDFSARKTFEYCKNKIKKMNRDIRSGVVWKINRSCTNIEEFQKARSLLLPNKDFDYDSETEKFSFRFSRNRGVIPDKMFKAMQTYHFYEYAKKLKHLDIRTSTPSSDNVSILKTGVLYDQKSCKKELLNRFAYPGKIYIGEEFRWDLFLKGG